MQLSFSDAIQALALFGGGVGMIFMAGRVFAEIKGQREDIKGLRESMQKWGERMGEAEIAIGTLRGILSDRTQRGA